ncbi:MAG: sulfotransferase [Xanthomonadales bacterium]|nr:sulfotransferase [Gammaproteobacteria bacterium]NND57188.1 sulfotransferase [Xanthomonadales bacterium]NNK50252.1 sulfotransferase [Xanthomonadales bacterium]
MKAVNQPVFVLGILPRSGTNFLYNLLMLHPDCAPPDPVWEDFLVSRLDLLAQYSDEVAAQWDPRWGVDARTQQHLDRSLGSGIARFLQERCSGFRVVAKTPRVDNIEHFFRFFPEAKLLILVRDGRSIVESAIKSFGWRREPALHSLAEAARTINAFRQKTAGFSERFRIVRYEDLWLDTENQLYEIGEFLELDMETYDLQRALNLPLRGSSELKSGPAESVHWDPMDRPDDFDPMSRFTHWSDARHFRYNRIAGPAMQALGYEPKAVKNPGGLFSIQGLVLDAGWLLKSLLRPLYRRLRNS